MSKTATETVLQLLEVNETNNVDGAITKVIPVSEFMKDAPLTEEQIAQHNKHVGSYLANVLHTATEDSIATYGADATAKSISYTGEIMGGKVTIETDRAKTTYPPNVPHTAENAVTKPRISPIVLESDVSLSKSTLDKARAKLVDALNK